MHQVLALTAACAAAAASPNAAAHHDPDPECATWSPEPRCRRAGHADDDAHAASAWQQ